MAKAKKIVALPNASQSVATSRELYRRLRRLWAEEKPHRYEFSLLRIEEDARERIASDDLQEAGWAWMVLGGVAVKRGDAQGMSEALEAALDLLDGDAPGFLTALVNHAEGWLSFQRLDLATLLLEKAHQAAPGDREILERLVELRLFQGRFHQARSLAQRLTELDPSRLAPLPGQGERIVRFLRELEVEDDDIAPMLHAAWECFNVEGVECRRVEAAFHDWHLTVRFHLPLEPHRVDDLEELYVERLMELDVPVRAVENLTLIFLPEARAQRANAAAQERCASA
ncbi:MAG: hypothetical protein HQL51_01540 [Magnetococcales bacterium]|nr:hypothetical protein [Magnetococcales bacterium]